MGLDGWQNVKSLKMIVSIAWCKWTILQYVCGWRNWLQRVWWSATYRGCEKMFCWKIVFGCLEWMVSCDPPVIFAYERTEVRPEWLQTWSMVHCQYVWASAYLTSLPNDLQRRRIQAQWEYPCLEEIPYSGSCLCIFQGAEVVAVVLW